MIPLSVNKREDMGNTPVKELIHMNEKKQKPIRLEDIQKMEGEEKLKYEIAEELGLLDKVLEGGWRALTSKETGRIGGIISKKRKDDLKN